MRKMRTRGALQPLNAEEEEVLQVMRRDGNTCVVQDRLGLRTLEKTKFVLLVDLSGKILDKVAKEDVFWN